MLVTRRVPVLAVLSRRLFLIHAQSRDRPSGVTTVVARELERDDGSSKSAKIASQFAFRVTNLGRALRTAKSDRRLLKIACIQATRHEFHGALPSRGRNLVL